MTQATSAAVSLVLAFVVFAGLAYLFVRGLEAVVRLRTPAGETYAPFDDRVVIALAAVTGFVGVWNVWHQLPIAGLILLALVCATLDYACCVDLRALRVPIWTALPVALLLVGIDWYEADYGALIAGALIASPFALASLKTKGRTGGVGDAAVASIGGLMLGAELGILTVAVACFAAAGVGFALRRQGRAIPFAPFLALTVQAALVLPSLHGSGAL